MVISNSFAVYMYRRSATETRPFNTNSEKEKRAKYCTGALVMTFIGYGGS